MAGLATVACVASLVACDDANSEGRDRHVSLIATAKGENLAVYARPGNRKPSAWLSNPTPVGAPRTFLILEHKEDRWLRVLLPTRPNGSKGWVHADDVTVSKTTYRVHVYLSDHRVVVKHAENEVVAKGPIGVGTRNTPTPKGDYYIISLLKTPGKNSPYGPYAFGLSGFSSVLKSFQGGPGRIGLHGTNKPELLGRDVSHGCIRLSNDDIRTLAHTLPLGTPVYVHS